MQDLADEVHESRVNEFIASDNGIVTTPPQLAGKYRNPTGSTIEPLFTSKLNSLALIVPPRYQNYDLHV